jgi:putative membrane protein insertion efficiency factor
VSPRNSRGERVADRAEVGKVAKTAGMTGIIWITWIVCMTLIFSAFPVWGGEAAARPERQNRLIRFYQDHLSGADGSRCPMVPSCSEYAAQAVRKHGPVKGWIMACDRILRCGRSEMKLAPRIYIQGQPYAHDPVSRNDFWWFTPWLGEEGTNP